MVYRMKGQFDSSIHMSNIGIKKAKKSEDLWGFYLNRSITKTFDKQYESAKIDLDSARFLCPDTKLLEEFEGFYELESSRGDLSGHIGSEITAMNISYDGMVGADGRTSPSFLLHLLTDL